MRAVRFVAGNPPYNSGEIAGFDDAVAQRLVESGAAIFVESAPPVVESAPPVVESAPPVVESAPEPEG